MVEVEPAAVFPDFPLGKKESHTCTRACDPVCRRGRSGPYHASFATSWKHRKSDGFGRCHDARAMREGYKQRRERALRAHAHSGGRTAREALCGSIHVWWGHVLQHPGCPAIAGARWWGPRRWNTVQALQSMHAKTVPSAVLGLSRGAATGRHVRTPRHRGGTWRRHVTGDVFASWPSLAVARPRARPPGTSGHRQVVRRVGCVPSRH